MEIKEDYCNFETAKLLREKGFDAETNTYYYATSEYTKSEMYKSPNNTNWNNNEYYYSAPTHQMAIKWLREVYNIFIQINRDNQYYEGTPVTPITEHDKKRGHSSEYYAVVLDAKSNSNSFEHFDRYEEAVEAALKYVLENLI